VHAWTVTYIFLFSAIRQDNSFGHYFELRFATTVFLFQHGGRAPQGVAPPRRMKDRNDRRVARCSPPSRPIARMNNLQYGGCCCLRMIRPRNELSIFFIIDANFLSVCPVSVNVPFVHSIGYSYTFKELIIVGVSQLKIASFRITRPSCNSLASFSSSSYLHRNYV
jgi:hypothetical protein